MQHARNSDNAESSFVGLECEYPANYMAQRHCHDRSQLLYASSGLMSVTTSAASYVIPPQRALWIPAGHFHEVSCQGPVSLRTVYFKGTVAAFGTAHCCLVEISDFLKQLILEVAKMETEDTGGVRAGRIIRLLTDELARMPAAPYCVPMPVDSRLLRVCRAITARPADRRSLDKWADLAGMSRRSFTRFFRKETGTGLESWQRQVRLIRALSLLSEGLPITEVAYDVGYDSPSAFTAMFRRSFGVTPRDYTLGKGHHADSP